MTPDPQPQSPEQIVPTPEDESICCKCRERMDLVCDATGATEYYHCFNCNPAPTPQEEAFSWWQERGQKLSDAQWTSIDIAISAFKAGRASLEARAVKAEYALTAANAATSAMREELEELQQFKKEADAEGVVPASICQLLADTEADRDAWQRRAQESEARVKELEAQRDGAIAAREEALNHVYSVAAERDKAQADLSAAAKKHEAEVADYKWFAENPDKVRYIAPHWYSGYPDPNSLNPDKWSSTGQWGSLLDAIHAARNTASEPQQP